LHRKQLLLKLSPILLIVLVLIVGPLQSIEARIDPGSGSTPPAFYLIPNITRVEDRSAIAATGVDILEVGPDYVLVRASADEATQLRLKGYTLDNDPATLQRFALDTFPPADSGYHDYGEMVAEIQQAATDHPDILKLIDIGSSYEGRTIWLAKISSDVNLDENKPEVLFVHHQHAREHLTVEQGLYTLHLLLDNYGSDAQITQLVNSRVIWIIFDANPDGGEYDISGGTYYYWRKNRQPTSITGTLGIDLNRNWGYNWGCCFGSSPEPSSDIYRG
jgi:carboxypeptidase T